MGKHTIFDKLREWIGSLGFGVFLWSIKMSQEQYWNVIYRQEKQYLESPAAPRSE